MTSDHEHAVGSRRPGEPGNALKNWPGAEPPGSGLLPPHLRGRALGWDPPRNNRVPGITSIWLLQLVQAVACCVADPAGSSACGKQSMDLR